jgi:hypothetical protein
MPGSVTNAAPSTVLPWSLCRSFVHAREYAAIENDYKNGESQRSLLVATSRKRWDTSRRLTPDVLAAFLAFYEARKGSSEPFYFYDPWDALFAYDPTGASATGRYTVRFDCEWNQIVGIGRIDVGIALIELA